MQTETITKFVRVNPESGAQDDAGIMVMVSTCELVTDARSFVARIECKYGSYVARKEYDRDGSELGFTVNAEPGSEFLPKEIALNIIHANHFHGMRWLN